MASPTNDFNISNEIDVQNKYANYELTSEEKQNIWKTIQERDDLIKEEQKDYKENYMDRVDAEYEQLRGQQQPRPQMHYVPQGQSVQPNNQQLYNQASQNVQAQHRGKIQDYQNQANQKIDTVLDKAREEGRYNDPDQNQNQTLTQEFNQNAQNGYDQDVNRDR